MTGYRTRSVLCVPLKRQKRARHVSRRSAADANGTQTQLVLHQARLNRAQKDAADAKESAKRATRGASMVLALRGRTSSSRSGGVAKAFHRWHVGTVTQVNACAARVYCLSCEWGSGRGGST